MIFMPYSDLTRSAIVLDPLTKEHQLNEILSVLEHLHDENNTGYVNEHLLNAWRGYEPKLAFFGELIVEALDTGNYHEEYEALRWHLETATSGEYTMDAPPWTSDGRIHLTHRMVLLSMDPVYYGKRFDTVTGSLIYWPS